MVNINKENAVSFFEGFEKRANWKSRVGPLSKAIKNESDSIASRGKSIVQKAEGKVVQKSTPHVMDYSQHMRPQYATDGKVKPLGYKGG